MKSVIVAIASILIGYGSSTAQGKKFDIGFKEKESNSQRRNKEDVLHKVLISADVDGINTFKNKVTVSIDSSSTTILPKHFSVSKSIENVQFEKLKAENVFELRFTAETEPEIKRKLVLKLKIIDSTGSEVPDSLNKNKNLIHEVNILPALDTIKNYSFLGYLGTNFDLVDGIKAKNLFFAINAFIPEKKTWGISIGLYGNRTLTRTDTSRGTSFTSKIVSLGDTTILYFKDTATKVSSRVSDNLGAVFSPLIPIRVLNDGDLKIYYAPQFEFIWRRTTIDESYQDTYTYRIDTIKRSRPLGGATLITPLKIKTELNIYDVYIGLVGFLLKYETDDISLRLNSSVGWSYSYSPTGALSSPNLTYTRKERKFLFVRLWLTEPTTGMTLGAEMSNYFGNGKALPYYNVTLSKAFNLKSLVAFIQPITKR